MFCMLLTHGAPPGPDLPQTSCFQNIKQVKLFHLFIFNIKTSNHIECIF